MRLKIPPPFVMVIFGGIMYLVDRFLPFGDFVFFGQQYLYYALGGTAFVIILTALVQFRMASTTTDPIAPDKASKLVTSGIYQYTRNPMYLAMLLMLLAFGLKLGNAFNTMVAAGFVFYMNHFQIKPEEEALGKLFGKAYQQYCTLARRWF